MPILPSDFNPSLPFKNAHLSTVYRALYLKDKATYERKRVTTWDNDFIDLDFSFQNSNTLVLLVHGLEGNSNSNYIVRTSNYLNDASFDTVCMNLRGCSGEDNLRVETYHSGKTDDIDFVVKHLASNYDYDNIVLCGFSLGGNLVLKYLGEYQDIPETVKGGIGVSVPIDLTTSQLEMLKPKNKVYMVDFMKTLKKKVLQKSEKHESYTVDKELLSKATKFHHIESLYTVPVFGFESPEDYYQKSSAKPYLKNIKHNTLLISAKDDTFLSESCYPYKEAEASENFYLITPEFGGHVGFLSAFKSKNDWMENQIMKFIQQQLNIAPKKQ